MPGGGGGVVVVVNELACAGKVCSVNAGRVSHNRQGDEEGSVASADEIRMEKVVVSSVQNTMGVEVNGCRADGGGQILVLGQVFWDEAANGGIQIPDFNARGVGAIK